MTISYKLLVYISVLLVSCKKFLAENTGNTTSRIIVKEYATGIPLPDAQIKLYTCDHFDILYGCQGTSQFATLITDRKGECTITQAQLTKASKGIVMSKSQYWDRPGGPGVNLLEPEAWVKLSLTAINNYPDTSFFVLRTPGQHAISVLGFKAPLDSVINFQLFGDETNAISWMVYTTKGYCPYCSYDTLSRGGLTLHPKKFENLTASINY